MGVKDERKFGLLLDGKKIKRGKRGTNDDSAVLSNEIGGQVGQFWSCQWAGRAQLWLGALTVVVCVCGGVWVVGDDRTQERKEN